MERTLPVYEFMRLPEPIQKVMTRWWNENNTKTIFPKFAKSDLVSYLSDTIGKKGETYMISPKLINGDFFVMAYLLEKDGKELAKTYHCDGVNTYLEALVEACVQATYTKMFGI